MSAKLFAVETIDPAVNLFRKDNEEKGDKDQVPFLETTMGKVSLGLAGAAIGAGAVYLYNKSQADKV
jgi:hypothetical protein